MSYIDIVILRHLHKRPAHGYELRKRVEATTGFVLHKNSLYPALKRFEEAGAVTKTAQPQEGKPPRHVYEITGVGRELLHEMIAELRPEEAADESEFLARVGQFSLLAPEERIAVLDARDDALRTRIEHLGALVERSGGEPWGRLVTRELVRRAKAERTWLAKLRTAAHAEAPEPGDD